MSRTIFRVTITQDVPNRELDREDRQYFGECGKNGVAKIKFVEAADEEEVLDWVGDSIPIAMPENYNIDVELV